MTAQLSSDSARAAISLKESAFDLENHADRCAAGMAFIANLPVVDEGGSFACLKLVLSHKQLNLGAEPCLFNYGLPST